MHVGVDHIELGVSWEARSSARSALVAGTGDRSDATGVTGLAREAVVEIPAGGKAPCARSAHLLVDTSFDLLCRCFATTSAGPFACSLGRSRTVAQSSRRGSQSSFQLFSSDLLDLLLDTFLLEYDDWGGDGNTRNCIWIGQRPRFRDIVAYRRC